MADWDDVRRLALALPETSEGTSWGTAHWRVGKRSFVWDRPLRRSDREALGPAAPEGPILGAYVEHLVAKEALLADPSGLFLTIPHLDGYAIVLARLEPLGLDALEEIVTEAWLCRAPKRLAQRFLDTS